MPSLRKKPKQDTPDYKVQTEMERRMLKNYESALIQLNKVMLAGSLKILQSKLK